MKAHKTTFLITMMRVTLWICFLQGSSSLLRAAHPLRGSRRSTSTYVVSNHDDEANTTGTPSKVATENLQHNDSTSSATSTLISSHDGSSKIPDFNSTSLSSMAAFRQLQQDLPYFQPLSCNRDPCKMGSFNFSTLDFGLEETIVIPCGWCVTMDLVGDVSFMGGIDIQGHFKIPNGHAVNLETPFIFVQGRLDIISTRIVREVPRIKITITGESSQHYLKPHSENAHLCPSGGCAVGAKPIVVAGGKIKLRGMSTSCTSWTHLVDTTNNGKDVPDIVATARRSSRCGGGILEQQTFDAPRLEWSGGYGTMVSTLGGTLLVEHRKSAQDHGPLWDLEGMRHCLEANQPYLFSARVKLSNSTGQESGQTTCATSGAHCLTLFAQTRHASMKTMGRRKGWEVQDQASSYDEWFDFYATVRFEEAEVDPDNIYQLLQLRGPEAGVDIELDNVTFALPEVPAGGCQDDLILNGKADSSAIHPYPIESVGGHVSVVEDSTGNSFFRQVGRTQNRHSVVFYIHWADCLAAEGRYDVSAKIRVGRVQPTVTKLRLRSYKESGSLVSTLLTCPASTLLTWVVCSGTVTMPSHLVGDEVSKVRLEFETENAPSAIMDVDDVHLKLANGAQNAIIVQEEGVNGCWDDGAEILVTSHTLDYRGQVRRIVGSPTRLGDGTVQLDLDEALVPPTTMRENPDFAVEVALLSRNVVLQGAPHSSNDLLGAHFMVFKTPFVSQTLDAVEFDNFGQQGILGRYPIHFHLSEDVKGTVVSRNSIRRSKQRCVVIHGSHNVTIENNVAYDTFGHCYMLEDGGEIDNSFIRNLGAETKPARFMVSNSESDHVPSTFWCTHPSNEWVGNVAAGSSHSGFWFELRQSVRGPTAGFPLSAGMRPRFTDLQRFEGNVAHSNGNHGMRTYPHGFMPKAEAVFLDCKSYRNKLDGWFLHNSRNLAIKGGILADNALQADLDVADVIRIQGTSIIGLSPEYKRIVETQTSARRHEESIVGIELHGFARDTGSRGARIRDVEFSGFEETGSSGHVALIQVDSDRGSGHFNYWTTLYGVRVVDDIGQKQFDFMNATKFGYQDIFITDLDSGMRPAGSSASGTSTVMSDSVIMTTFVDTSNCEDFGSSQGYLYCSNTCLGTYSFAVDPAGTEGYMLRVSKSGRSVDIPGHYDSDHDDNRNTLLRKSRVFAASLPSGSYSAEFVSESGATVWPSYVEESLGEAQCPDGLEVGDVAITIPSVVSSDCEELIRNGDFELNDDKATFWLHQDSGLELLPTGGRRSSNGLSDKFQTEVSGSVGQFIDNRCLIRRRQYEVTAWIFLRKGDTVVACDTAGKCPEARIRVRTPDDEEGSSFDEFSDDIALHFTRPFNERGWNRLHGVFNVDPRVAQGASVAFLVRRGMTNTKMILDDVSLSLIPPHQCDELVFNGGLDDGTSRFWEPSHITNNLDLDIVTRNGNTALQTLGRSMLAHSPMQSIRLNCLVRGKRYLVKAKVRVENPRDGSLYSCDVTKVSGNLACPRIKLRSIVNFGLGDDQDSKSHSSIAVTDHGSTSDGWLAMSGLFVANEFDADADKLYLTWEATPGKDLVIDDVSISRWTESCHGELVVNGDAEYSKETPSFWRSWRDGGKSTIGLIDYENSVAFRITGRSHANDGMYQFLNPACFIDGSSWRVEAKMRIFNVGGGLTCDPGSQSRSNGCPPVHIFGWDCPSGANVDTRLSTTSTQSWSANSLNHFQAILTVDSELARCERTGVAIRTYNLEWDIILDEISIQPL